MRSVPDRRLARPEPERGFESSRLEEEWLAAAYALVVSASGRSPCVAREGGQDAAAQDIATAFQQENNHAEPRRSSIGALYQGLFRSIDRLYVHSPDRLARRYAYQVLLLDELQRAAVEVVFLNHDIGQTPEDQLLLQVQGMVAEYERAKLLERCRHGKLHAARQGSVNALAGAPYGYRYVRKADAGGVARYDVLLQQARVVQSRRAGIHLGGSRPDISR